MASKKHFEAIATVFRDAEMDLEAKQRLVQDFCSIGRLLNPRFDRTRFYRAVFCIDAQDSGGRTIKYSRFLPPEHTVLTEKQMARKVKAALTGRKEWQS